MRVAARGTIEAPREQVWAVISDPTRYCQFLDGATMWQVAQHPGSGDCRSTGLGARWRIRMKVGSAQVGGDVEVVEYDEPGDLAWNSVTGVTMRGRWRLRERTPGRTEVTTRLAYQAPGGLIGLIVDRVAALLVSRSLDRSVRNLQALVEGRELPA